MSIKSDIAATLKSSDTEETLDIYFYRPIGYFIALFASKVGITPNPITIISIVFGVIAGRLFYYPDLTLNIIGIVSLVFANSLDSADGQLARMTNNCTKLGRFLDGFAGNLWFVSIYINIALRLMNEGQDWTIFLFIVLVGVVHSMQAAMADFYRSQHLFFIGKNSFKDIEDPIEIKKEYDQVTWTKNPVRKIYWRFYLNYVSQQQVVARNYWKFFRGMLKKFGKDFPQNIKDEFRGMSKPLMKYTNILTTNTRMITLFIAVLMHNLWIYLAFELTILNVLLAYMVVKHESLSKKLYKKFIEA